MWAIRKAVWNKIATLKFGANKPVRIPVPQDDERVLKAVSLASLYPRIPIANALVGDHVPTDEASGLKSGFYDVQVDLYGGLSPMEPGLPAIDADPRRHWTTRTPRRTASASPPPCSRPSIRDRWISDRWRSRGPTLVT